MRVGIYLGRHLNASTGMATYSRALLFGALRLLDERQDRHSEIVFYGDSVVLSEEVLKAVGLAPVLSAVSDSAFDRGASVYFRPLPNGARCQVLVRLLPSLFGRKVSTLLDQLVIPLWTKLDKVSLLYSCANMAVPFARAVQGVTVHDLFQAFPPVTNSEPSLRSRILSTFYRRFFDFQFRRVEFVATVSKPVAAEIAEKYKVPRERLSVIPNGIDDAFERFLRAKNRVELVDGWLKAKQLKRGYTLVLAGSDPRKNLARLVGSWKRLPNATKRRGLVINLLDDGAKAVAREVLGDEFAADEVYFVSNLERREVPLIFAGAGVLHGATLAEGFGLPLVEAQAVGTAVVSSRAGAAAAGVTADSVQGIFLCDPEDEVSMSTALLNAHESIGEAQSTLEKKHADSRRTALPRTMFDMVNEMFALFQGYQLKSGRGFSR